MSLLEKADADGLRRFLVDAIWNEDEEEALRALRAGADPNSKTGLGSPALCEAAELGLPGIVVELLKAGADPTVRDPRRQSKSAYAVALDGGLHALPAVKPLAEGLLAWAGDDPGRLARALLCAMSDDRPLLKDCASGTLAGPLAARLILSAPGDSVALSLAMQARENLAAAESSTAEVDAALEAVELRGCGRDGARALGKRRAKRTV